VHERAAAEGRGGGVMTSSRFARRATVFLLAPLLCAFEPLRSENREVEQGNAAMQAGKAEEALKHYEAAVAKLAADPAAHFDRGTALYALSRFDEAGQEFLRATEAKDGALKAAAFYNLGNAFFKKDKFKEAVEAYKRALGLDPKDQRAKWNLEIALRKQKDEEDKKKKDQENKDDKNKDDKKDQKKDQDKDKQKDDKKDQNKDQNKDQKKDQDKDKQQQDQQKKSDDKGNKPDKPPLQEAADQKEIEAVLDSLEKSPKDLEKERARIRAVRRRPPPRDW
jgi:tetratricopeptide (TPR) repeat protein